MNEINNKELCRETKVIQKVFNSPRMNQYIILFDMLNEPDIRYCTNDYLGVLSDETAYLMVSFKLLQRKKLISFVGKFGKENLFDISPLQYEKARDFVIERVMRYIKNQHKQGNKEVTTSEVMMAFKNILNFTPMAILEKKIKRNNRQLIDYPNEALFVDIRNKLQKEKQLLNERTPQN